MSAIIGDNFMQLVAEELYLYCIQNVPGWKVSKWSSITTIDDKNILGLIIRRGQDRKDQ